MAKLKQSRGKLVRKFGENIFGNPKYDRLLNRKPYGPGQHAQSRRGKVSNYGIQLQEKQKIKFMYGLLEKQFRIVFKKAEKLKGETGTNMLQLLESRLDNIVYRLGFAPTRPAARQLVSHKHFLVNGKPVNIPSFILKPGDNVFYFTTCGWMIWNWLLTFLASKASIVLFDGFPMYKKDDLLLKIAEDEKISLFAETELEKKQKIINYTKEFIKLYPDEFDILEIAKKILSIKFTHILLLERTTKFLRYYLELKKITIQ